jgi:hypothetical protein
MDYRSFLSIYDFYKELFKSTNGSHVTIYNQQQYGSVYEETLEEFFPFILHYADHNDNARFAR